jgi:hypothetical protein
VQLILRDCDEGRLLARLDVVRQAIVDLLQRPPNGR